MVSSNNALPIDCQSVKIEYKFDTEDQQFDGRDQTQSPEEPEPQYLNRPCRLELGSCGKMRGDRLVLTGRFLGRDECGFVVCTTSSRNATPFDPGKPNLTHPRPPTYAISNRHGLTQAQTSPIIYNRPT